MLSAADIARELIRLKKISDETHDGQPEGLGDTEAALLDYFMDHFDFITDALLRG